MFYSGEHWRSVPDSEKPRILKRVIDGYRYPALKEPFVWVGGKTAWPGELPSNQQLHVREILRREPSLSFYPGWSLYALDLDVARDLGKHAQKRYEWLRICFLLRDEDGAGDEASAVLLDGRGPTIHEFNKRIGLELTPDTALEYLDFFTASVYGDLGPFLILKKAEDLVDVSARNPAAETFLQQFGAKSSEIFEKTEDRQAEPRRSEGSGKTIAEARETIRPPYQVTLRQEDQPESGKQTLAVTGVSLQYGGNLFDSSLAIVRDQVYPGNVIMLGDNTVASDIPIVSYEVVRQPLLSIPCLARRRRNFGYKTMLPHAFTSAGVEAFARSHVFVPGDLDLRGRTFKNAVKLDNWMIEGSLLLDRATFEDDLILQHCSILGGFSARRMVCQGRFRVLSTDVLGNSSRRDAPKGMVLRAAVLSRPVRLKRVRVAGELVLREAECKSKLEIFGLTTRPSTRYHNEEVVSGDVDALGCKVHRSFLMKPARQRSLAGETEALNDLQGRFNADHCEVGDELEVVGCQISAALTLTFAQVSGKLTLSGVVCKQNIDLSAATFSRGVSIEKTMAGEVTLRGSDARWLTCDQVEVRGSLDLASMTCTQPVVISSCAISGSLQLSGISADSEVRVSATDVRQNIEVFSGEIGSLQITPGLSVVNGRSTWKLARFNGLLAQHLNVHGDLSCWGAECVGDFELEACTIDARCNFWRDIWPRILGRGGSDIAEPNALRVCTSIKGKLDLQGLSATSVDLTNLKVAGKILLNHARIRNQIRAAGAVEGTSMRTICGGLDLEDARCEGNADLSGIYVCERGAAAKQIYEAPFSQNNGKVALPLAFDLKLENVSAIKGGVKFPLKWKLQESPGIREELLVDVADLEEVDSVDIQFASSEKATAEFPDVAARNFNVAGTLTMWRPPHDATGARFAHIEGRLDLSNASAAEAKFCGDSFDRGSWACRLRSCGGNRNELDRFRPWLQFERAKFGRFSLCEPFPFSVDFGQMEVGQWDFYSADGSKTKEDYLTLLSFSDPFRRSTYLDLIRTLRDQGRDDEVVKLWDAMHDREFKRGWGFVDDECQACRQLAAPGSHGRSLLARAWHKFKKEQTHFYANTWPLFRIWLILLAASVVVFWQAGNIVPSPEQLGENVPDPGTAFPLRYTPYVQGSGKFAESHPADWGLVQAASLALRYHVPPIQLFLDRRWEPASNGPMMIPNPLRLLAASPVLERSIGCETGFQQTDRYAKTNGRPTHCSTHLAFGWPWPSPLTWATVMTLLNWLMVPALLYGFFARRFRSPWS